MIHGSIIILEFSYLFYYEQIVVTVLLNSIVESIIRQTN